jgi:hypothetical protein
MKYTKFVVYAILYLFTIGIVVLSLVLTPHPFDSPLIRSIRVIIVFFASILLAKYTIYMLLAPWYGVLAKRDKALTSHSAKYYRP